MCGLFPPPHWISQFTIKLKILARLSIEIVNGPLFVLKNFLRIKEGMLNLTVTLTDNVTNYFVYINNLFYGESPSVIQINNGDTLQINIQKLTLGEESTISLEVELL